MVRAIQNHDYKVVSSATPDFIDRFMPSYQILSNYCKRHGYGYELIALDVAKINRPPSWYKLQALISAIDENKYEYLLWCDSDTLIINKELEWDGLINDRSKDFLFSKNWSGLNAGIFIVRCSETARESLQKVWDYNGPITGGNWEQEVILKLMDIDKKFSDSIAYIPSKTLNAYDIAEYKLGYDTHGDYQFDKDSLFLHAAGKSLHDRERILAKYIKQFYPSK